MFGLAQVDRLKGEVCLIMTDMADIVLLILLSLHRTGRSINFDVVGATDTYYIQVVKPHG